MKIDNFENSFLYKEALEKYHKEVFGKILKPLHSIVMNYDEVYLFYEQNIVNDIFLQLKEIYLKEYNDEKTNFPISLGCEEPRIIEITFMGIKYKAISLWYDGGDVPKEFEAKI